MKSKHTFQKFSDQVIEAIDKETEKLKGATKFYFTHYACVVIILFNMGLYKSAFSTDSFGKLAFCLSVLCQTEFDITFINFITFALNNYCLYKYQVLCVFVLIYY